MPTNYTVQSGDTLSKIASQYGVSSTQISGYKSGNPNLIYPGEQLVIPTAEIQQPVSQVQPAQTVVNATGLTGESPIDTNVIGKTSASTTSSYSADIESLRGLQTEALKGATGLETPGIIETANQYGYTTNTQKLEALQPEISALEQELADLKAAENATIEKQIAPGATQDYYMGMKGRIQRDFAIRESAVSANLGVKVAMAQAYQGNIDRSLSTAEKIVSDLNMKNTQKRQDMEMFYNYYGDVINSLTAKEKTELDNAREDIIRQESYGREDYTRKITALANAAYNGLDVSAISGDDIANKNEEEIITMISNAAQKKLQQDRQFELGLKTITSGATAGNIDQNTLNAVMANPQLYFTLPIHTREAVATALQAQGYDITQLQSPAFVGKSKAAIASFNSAVAMTDTLENLWNGTTPAASWVTSLVQAPGKLLAGAVGKDEAVKLYENQKKAFLSMISRALGEKGVLTDYDLARVERALPKIGDNASIAQKDFATLAQILDDIKSGTTIVYGGVTTNTPNTTAGVSDEQLNNFLNGIGF